MIWIVKVETWKCTVVWSHDWKAQNNTNKIQWYYEKIDLYIGVYNRTYDYPSTPTKKPNSINSEINSVLCLLVEQWPGL